MVGVADNDNLAAILVQLPNDILGPPDQDTCTVNNLQVAKLGLAKDLGPFAVRTNQNGSSVRYLIQSLGYVKALAPEAFYYLRTVDQRPQTIHLTPPLQRSLS